MTIHETWEQQYGSETVTALKDKNLFDLEVRALEAALLKALTGTKKLPHEIKILELGCGSGELIRRLSAGVLTGYAALTFYGVDFSENAINAANRQAQTNQVFVRSDFIEHLKSLEDNSIPIIISQRSLMALMNKNDQVMLLEQINRVLSPEGVGIFSECFYNDLVRFNKLREQAGLGAIAKVWHSLYLDESMFTDTFAECSFDHFCSTYMLLTRVIYPMFEEPKHNQLIHEIAAKSAEAGDSSFLKIAKVRKSS